MARNELVLIVAPQLFGDFESGFGSSKKWNRNTSTSDHVAAVGGVPVQEADHDIAASVVLHTAGLGSSSFFSYLM